MKKIVALFMLMLLGTVGIQAQEKGERVMESPERIEFKPYWFMQVQGGVSMISGQDSYRHLISPAVALNFGRQFNKLFALRFGVSGWEGKGRWLTPENNYAWNYVQGNVDAVFDLSTLLAGWKHDRVFNLYGFVGVGLNGAFNNDDAVAMHGKNDVNFRNLWDDSKCFAAGRGGLGFNVRLSQRVAMNLELNANVLSDKYNSKKTGNADWQFNGLVGLKIDLGKNHKVIPAVYSYVVPKTEPVPEKKPEPEPEPEPTPVVETVDPMTVNVFFVIGRSEIRDSEKAKLDEFVAFMKEHEETKAVLTGYADKETGTKKINMTLSQKRAKAVMDYLTEKGISMDRIEVQAKGDTVQPFDTQKENRVSICIAE